MPAALILAAGRSRRFGTDKALVEVGGRTLLQRQVEGFRAAGVETVVVVRRADAAPLPGLNVVLQPGDDAPMFDSLVRGLQAVSSAQGAVFVTPVDVPPIRPELLRRLIAASTDDAEVIAPTFDGHRGHPLLLTAHGLAQLLADARHARIDRLDHWLDLPGRRLVRIDATADATLDFDTPDALERWKNSRSDTL